MQKYLASQYFEPEVLMLQLEARNVRVTQDELTYLQENLTDLVQVDNGDYPAVLGIFHHLHCLNNLRKIVHWDYYESRVELPDESLSKGHSGMLPVDGGSHKCLLTN